MDEICTSSKNWTIGRLGVKKRGDTKEHNFVSIWVKIPHHIELHSCSSFPVIYLIHLDIASTTAPIYNALSSSPLLLESLAPFLVPDMPVQDVSDQQTYEEYIEQKLKNAAIW